jgi:superfamily II DNA or RNA helicase
MHLTCHRHYQQNRHGQVLLVLPTGVGKTVIFTQVIRKLELPTLIIAHRDELLDQAAEKYRLIKPDAIIGKVGNGSHEYGGEVTVASVATLSRKRHLKRLQDMDYRLVIVDEAHHAAAAGYRKVLGALPDAFKLLVTATPDRLDGQPIIDHPALYSCSVIDMICNDPPYLCDVRAIAIRTDTNLDAIHTKMGDYSEKELDLAINTPARNMRVVEAYQEHAEGRIAICFAVTVDHAYALADAFNESGVPAGTVCGETPTEERKRLYKALRSGEIKVLTNVQVLTEGFDEPLVDCIIMARPTQSRALYVQCIGRGLRLAPAKKDCLILDLTDNCMRHRLQPQTLGKVLNTRLANGESVKEQVERVAEEHEQQEHKLKAQRKQDVQIDLLEALEWERHGTGIFTLDVGEEKHRISLVPSDTRDGYYRVVARLAPYFQLQNWGDEQPLSWAQQIAEKRALMLKDSNKRVLVDMNAPWRKGLVDLESRQAELLRKYRFEITPGMTKGDASDLLSAKFAQIERWKQGQCAS